MITEITGTCQFEGCDQPAEVIAVGRNSPLGCYCEKHGAKIVEESSPEYAAYCPNCGCGFPVN